VTFIIVKTRSFLRDCRINRVAKALYNDVFEELKNLEGGVNGLS
jgi:hypothetical protein